MKHKSTFTYCISNLDKLITDPKIVTQIFKKSTQLYGCELLSINKMLKKRFPCSKKFSFFRNLIQDFLL